MRAAGESLWVTRPDEGELLQVDPADGEVVATIAVAPGGTFLAADEEGVWVLGSDEATVTRVDPSSGEVVASIIVGDVPILGGDISIGGGYVWARATDTLVVQIDPASNAVVARFGEPEGSGSVAADSDAVWISAHDTVTLYRMPLP